MFGDRRTGFQQKPLCQQGGEGWHEAPEATRGWVSSRNAQWVQHASSWCSSSCLAPSAPYHLNRWVLVSWLRLSQTPDSGGSSSLCPLLRVCPALGGGQHKWPWTEWEPGLGMMGSPGGAGAWIKGHGEPQGGQEPRSGVVGSPRVLGT